MNTKKKEFCPHCHQPVMKNKQMLTRALGDILLTAACKFRAGEPFHLQRDLNLTKSQYNNFQKLRYWGLVKKTFLLGKRAGGFWELTGLTGAFIHGKPLPRVKWTFNNEVVGAGEEMTTLELMVGSFEAPEKWAELAIPVMTTQGKLF